MKISVIVMPLPTGTGFKARTGEPWSIAAEGADPERAFASVADNLRARAPEAELVRVDVPEYDRLFDVIGVLDPDSPAWEAWSAAVEEYRQQQDGAPVPSRTGA